MAGQQQFVKPTFEELSDTTVESRHLRIIGVPDHAAEIMRALYDAIPDHEYEQLARMADGYEQRRGPHGGVMYDLDSVDSVLATYNNTRPGPAEVAAWFRRAQTLLL